ncbi:fumarylacetoacetate hydrolase family protein [Roseococcus sp. DSY-14]|uniref:fumarylacetoacetate hydrolase family protein n=1 Tax=Roseococcus sp. DSY-14 TaxID=3369650 RepID=UPI00387B8569
MKLLSFLRPDGTAACGVVVEGGVADLSRRLGVPSLRALLEAGRLEEARGVTQPDLPLEGLRFLPVIPEPSKIVCVGLNYRDHVAETGRTVTEKPALFVRFPESQVGHAEPIIRPRVSERFDYEGELAVIIGTGGRHIPRARALAHVAGYSCYNEGSVRDWQLHTSQFLPGKSFDRSGSFGPWMVTADEIPDPAALTLETRLNGQVVQHTTTDLMITDVPGVIEYLSTVLPLRPGDVIVSGTPGGVGAKRNPPLWMKPGDVAEVEISGIGVLRNVVEDEG